MSLIRDVVKRAMETGCLTLEAEENLRNMLNTHYAQEDLEAFVKLQRAAMRGKIRQESREMSFH